MKNRIRFCRNVSVKINYDFLLYYRSMLIFDKEITKDNWQFTRLRKGFPTWPIKLIVMTQPSTTRVTNGEKINNVVSET